MYGETSIGVVVVVEVVEVNSKIQNSNPKESKVSLQICALY
jgi:hypothetical protein